MRAPAVLAIDEGTTGVTCLVVERSGRVAGRAYSEFTQSFPRPGWVEHDPEEIWLTALRTAREALAAARDVEVRSVGITNQRETVALWERESLKPVAPAVVWQDRRTADVCARLRAEGCEEAVRERTGLLLDPYFSATKIAWLLNSGDGRLRRRAESGDLAAGTMDTWLIARLTDGEVHATDPTNASRTMLYGLTDRDWDPCLADLLAVPLELLPEIRPSAGSDPAFGTTAARHLGASLPIGGVAGDQQAALFGQGCTRAGLAKNTYGTGAFLLLHTGRTVPKPPPGLLATAACGPRGEKAYALEGSVLVAGAAVQWLRDTLGLIDSAGDTEAMASALPDNGGVRFVPAFTGLGAPHWEPDARGTILGLSRGTKPAHLARAALEAMAHGSADVLDAMTAGGEIQLDELRVDGGAAVNSWLMQFQADLLAVPVRRPANVESTALGAAGLAGVSAGLWSDSTDFVNAVESASAGTDLFRPTAAAASRESERREWRRAVNAALTWARDG